MVFNSSFYEILEITKNSSIEEIKSAFRKLAMVHHPDKNNNSPASQAHFVLLLNAYNTLVDPLKRQEYDTYLGMSNSFCNRGKPSPYKKPALPGRNGDIYRSNEELLHHFNFLLWDIEDLIRNMKKTGRGDKFNHISENQYILKILTFIDKWILEQAGFPDYFMEARKKCRIDPTDYIKIIGGNQSGHRPFINISDYFYAIRIRMDRFLKHITMNDLVKKIAHYNIRLIDCIVEAQNYAIHYLSYLLQIRAGTGNDIPLFSHSNDCFTEKT
ncbi:MAG: J domain-containing protein [Spirochaetales bacterium]|nr:J domain-containing protein [Spirochaetales bacterium]